MRVDIISNLSEAKTEKGDFDVKMLVFSYRFYFHNI
jgi:hypothetical protein